MGLSLPRGVDGVGIWACILQDHGSAMVILLHIRWILVLLGWLTLPGCLFVKKIEPVNKRSEARLDLVTEAPYYVGTRILLSAEQSRDPDGRIVRYDWSIDFDVTDGEGYQDCGAGYYSCRPGAAATCCFIPTAKTVFTIRLRTLDDRGLFSPMVERTVEVADRAPQALVTRDTVPNDQGHYTVGQEVWFHGLNSKDPDEGESLTYHWFMATRPPGSSTADFRFVPSDRERSPTDDPADAVRCLVVPDYPGTYEVGLTVSDGVLDATDTLYFEVDEDVPPCIGATSPDAGASVLVFSAGEDRRLEVLSVRDDLDPYPPSGWAHFRWFIRYEAEGPLVEVSGHDEPELFLPAGSFDPGQHIAVRVVVRDRVDRDLSGCRPDERECRLVSNCAQWVTWNIEFR